ncbi:hypothetical protein RCL1_005001 [Eukaryota sp. TZLM3-RCL]
MIKTEKVMSFCLVFAISTIVLGSPLVMPLGNSLYHKLEQATEVVPLLQVPTPTFHVDRSTLIKEILEKLKQSKLLRIEGPAGCGKTSLLREVMEKHGAPMLFLDGAYLVDWWKVGEMSFTHTYNFTYRYAWSCRRDIEKVIKRPQSMLIAIDNVEDARRVFFDDLFDKNLQHLYLLASGMGYSSNPLIIENADVINVYHPPSSAVIDATGLTIDEIYLTGTSFGHVEAYLRRREDLDDICFHKVGKVLGVRTKSKVNMLMLFDLALTTLQNNCSITCVKRNQFEDSLDYLLGVKLLQSVNGSVYLHDWIVLRAICSIARKMDGLNALNLVSACDHQSIVSCISREPFHEKELSMASSDPVSRIVKTMKTSHEDVYS